MVSIFVILFASVIVIAVIGGLLAFLLGAAVAFIPMMFKIGMIMVPVIFILALLAGIFGL